MLLYMKIIWRFLKQILFICSGAILLPLFLGLFFDLGFIKVSLITVLFIFLGSIWIIISTFKSIKGAFKSNPSNSYLNENIKQAKREVRQIRGYISEIPEHKQQPFINLYKSMKNMITIVEKYPQKYTQSKLFFNDLLPNTTTILERYQYLINQPIKSEEIKETLRKTEATIDDMKKRVDEELLKLLSDDAMKLDLDLQYIHHTNPKDTHHKPY